MHRHTFFVTLLCLGALAFCFDGVVAQSAGQDSYRFEKSLLPGSPFELTAADGTGLKLKLFQSKTVIEGPLAFTELRLTFLNPEDRVREGQFRITLPDGAAISRFAMRIDDQWQEAEVVELQAARQAYEDFLHRKQDPALLENAAGNEFSARIFPIPARGEKELILSYSQELNSNDYRLNLQGLPQIQDFEISVDREGAKKVVLQQKDFQPQGDFVLRMAGMIPSLSSGDLLVSRVTPDSQAAPAPLKDLLILVDTSASRALGFAEQQATVRSVVDALKDDTVVTVAAFDQSIEQVYSGPGSQLNLEKIQARGALGATNLKQALTWATGQKKHRRLLLVTDGIDTAGPTEIQGVLKGSHFERLDVVLVGGLRDLEGMQSLTQAVLPQDGLVIDGRMSGPQVAQRLESTVGQRSVSVEGSEWVWPTTLESLQPGDSRLIYAKFKSSVPDQVKVRLGGELIEVKPGRARLGPLLSRSVAVAQVARLENQLAQTEDPESKESLSQKIVELSTRNRVLSNKTALLVLETDQDYARFRIDRNALSDILVVGSSGLELQTRSKAITHAPPGEKVPSGERARKAESDGDSLFLSGTDDVAPDDTAQGNLSAPIGGEEQELISAPPAASNLATRSGVTAEGGVARPIQRESLSLSQARHDRPEPEERDSSGEESGNELTSGGPPLEGLSAQIDTLIKAGKTGEALAAARAWQEKEPSNVLALVALGDALQAAGQKKEAARAFGSIIDLFPSRADLRRYAGGRLQSLGSEGLSLAVDCFQKAVEQRPDHVSSHRFLAFALAREGRYREAVDALEAGLSRRYPEGRFRSYERILKDDLGILAAAWLAKSPENKTEVYARLKKYDSQLAKQPSLRFILTWETDANDVDFHIKDRGQGHAYYSQPKLASGGELYGDVTTGYGPECFAIEGPAKAAPYRLLIHYYSRGPMGYGMGQLEVLHHDGEGHLRFEERPYLVMHDGAYVDLGEVSP